LLSQQLSQIGPRAGSLAEGSIDDFDLLSLLGEGAFGKVLMVRHRKSGKIFAMKILRKSEVVRSDKPRQAIKERQILELIGDQPFVVRLYQSFQDEENLYLILRFAGGGDLFSQLEKRRRLPEDAARFYTAELVLALEALHRAQCVYRCAF
jgi:serum/glucocorticoid-regulated kinase 2